MATFEDVVREYFPYAGKDEVEYILWEKTGYPTFWHANDGATVEERLRKQLGDLLLECKPQIHLAEAGE